jgi:hypothetical protein
MRHITEAEYTIIKIEEMEKRIKELEQQVKLLQSRNPFVSKGRKSNPLALTTQVPGRYN